jgi:hypothetical protein
MPCTLIHVLGSDVKPVVCRAQYPIRRPRWSLKPARTTKTAKTIRMAAPQAALDLVPSSIVIGCWPVTSDSLYTVVREQNWNHLSFAARVSLEWIMSTTLRFLLIHNPCCWTIQGGREVLWLNVGHTEYTVPFASLFLLLLVLNSIASEYCWFCRWQLSHRIIQAWPTCRRSRRLVYFYNERYLLLICSTNNGAGWGCLGNSVCLYFAVIMSFFYIFIIVELGANLMTTGSFTNREDII